jgi:hypothetical protein
VYAHTVKEGKNGPQFTGNFSFSLISSFSSPNIPGHSLSFLSLLSIGQEYGDEDEREKGCQKLWKKVLISFSFIFLVPRFIIYLCLCWAQKDEKEMRYALELSYAITNLREPPHHSVSYFSLNGEAGRRLGATHDGDCGVKFFISFSSRIPQIYKRLIRELEKEMRYAPKNLLCRSMRRNCLSFFSNMCWSRTTTSQREQKIGTYSWSVTTQMLEKESTVPAYLSKELRCGLKNSLMAGAPALTESHSMGRKS